jgi:hypothetical protein
MNKPVVVFRFIAGAWVAIETYEIAKPEYHDWFQGSGVARSTGEIPRQNHSETGATGEPYRPYQISSGQSGAARVVDDDDGWWASHLRNYVASHSSRSSNTVFAPSSYTKF